MDASNKPYIIESPTRIRLGPEAKFWAREFKMTLKGYAQYLLDAHNERDDEEKL
jgi:hypothetical protein